MSQLQRTYPHVRRDYREHVRSIAIAPHPGPHTRAELRMNVRRNLRCCVDRLAVAIASIVPSQIQKQPHVNETSHSSLIQNLKECDGTYVVQYAGSSQSVRRKSRSSVLGSSARAAATLRANCPTRIALWSWRSRACAGSTPASTSLIKSRWSTLVITSDPSETAWTLQATADVQMFKMDQSSAGLL